MGMNQKSKKAKGMPRKPIKNGKGKKATLRDVKKSISHQNVPEVESNSALNGMFFDTVLKGDIEEIRKLKDYISPTGDTLLHSASTLGSVNVVEICINEFGHDLLKKNKVGNIPMHLSTINSPEVTSFYLGLNENKLIEMLKAKNERGNTPLMHMLISRNKDVIKMLDGIKDKDSVKEIVNTPNTKGDTPIMIASLRGATKEVECLMRNGANVNHLSVDGSGVIMFSLMGNNVKVIDMILDSMNKTALNFKREDGVMPLSIAIANDVPFSTIYKMIKAGSKINKIDKTKQTAMVAMLKNSTYLTTDLVKIIKYVDFEIDFDRKNDYNLLIHSVALNRYEFFVGILNKYKDNEIDLAMAFNMASNKNLYRFVKHMYDEVGMTHESSDAILKENDEAISKKISLIGI
jgi:ankyrin repeat protein